MGNHEVSTFVERAIERAGLGGILEARRAHDLTKVRAFLNAHPSIDILILGAIADAIREEECGKVVRVHPSPSEDVHWMDRNGKSELQLLRDVAHARITSARAAHIGVDWATQGLEIQQVAMGFGVTDLTGPLTRKAGALIDADALKKVKGQGMVAQTALRRLEIAALIQNAGRICQFTDEAAPMAGQREQLHAALETAHA
jgi:hypothetical protein